MAEDTRLSEERLREIERIVSVPLYETEIERQHLADIRLLCKEVRALQQREKALREALTLIGLDRYGPRGADSFGDAHAAWMMARDLAAQHPDEGAEDEWSRGEHLAEARAVEEHQERKHGV